jgi:hypothetical protein
VTKKATSRFVARVKKLSRKTINNVYTLPMLDASEGYIVYICAAEREEKGLLGVN